MSVFSLSRNTCGDHFRGPNFSGHDTPTIPALPWQKRNRCGPAGRGCGKLEQIPILACGKRQQIVGADEAGPESSKNCPIPCRLENFGSAETPLQF